MCSLLKTTLPAGLETSGGRIYRLYWLTRSRFHFWKVLTFVCDWNCLRNFGSSQSSLLCIVGELAVGGSLAERWEYHWFSCHSNEFPQEKRKLRKVYRHVEAGVCQIIVDYYLLPPGRSHLYKADIWKALSNWISTIEFRVIRQLWWWFIEYLLRRSMTFLQCSAVQFNVSL